MNDHVILNIGDKKFLLTPDEAFQIEIGRAHV